MDDTVSNNFKVKRIRSAWEAKIQKGNRHREDSENGPVCIVESENVTAVKKNAQLRCVDELEPSAQELTARCLRGRW